MCFLDNNADVVNLFGLIPVLPLTLTAHVQIKASQNLINSLLFCGIIYWYGFVFLFCITFLDLSNQCYIDMQIMTHIASNLFYLFFYVENFKIKNVATGCPFETIVYLIHIVFRELSNGVKIIAKFSFNFSILWLDLIDIVHTLYWHIG